MNHKKVFLIIIFMALWVWEGHAGYLACSEGITFKGKQYKCVVNHQTGRIWLDRNLGASRVATSLRDVRAYGDYYQWGRPTDGHEIKKSETSNIQLLSLHLPTKTKQDQPVFPHLLPQYVYSLRSPLPEQFITTHNDWLASGVDDKGLRREVFFSRIDGTGVCPWNFRVPTAAEWMAEYHTWEKLSGGHTNRMEAYKSVLKLPSAGARLLNGNMGGMGGIGFYWASEASESETAKYINFDTSTTNILHDKRAYGIPIRCIRATDEEIDGITFGVSIGGRITYDFVPGSKKGLDYAHTQKRPVRGVVVELLDRNGITITETNTDSYGRYNFANVPSGINVQIRIKAQMYKVGTPRWDVQVIDNTNDNKLYSVKSIFFNTGTSQKIKHIHLPSGWDRNSYTSARVAAPFAILDAIYKCMQLVLSVDPAISFPSLKINWSTNNADSTASYSIGSKSIYLRGKANINTDEYDAPVIAHEWGHYYVYNFSRSDSMGGSHKLGDFLDIRFAFNEGWGNAFAAMALNDPVFYNTSGLHQKDSSWGFNIESDPPNNTSGWFSEASVYRILYDLYDSGTDESFDTLSLGFGPIHKIMTGPQKNVGAFTSIFSFIALLKKARPYDADAIDKIVSHERIAP
ncbi:MAG: hypothetical protein LGB66_02880, partial [Sulfurovum sp.]|nr:hypothetical protein [Sulfurovum sp.]